MACQWKVHWQALIDPKIKEHQGRGVRITGDGPSRTRFDHRGFSRPAMQSSHRIICDRMVWVLPASPSPFSGPTI
jgi:hypothetical protein